MVPHTDDDLCVYVCVRCSLPIPDTQYTDALGTSAAIERLRNRTNPDRPFFFTVGLRKPHMDWALPNEFFEKQVPQKGMNHPLCK